MITRGNITEAFWSVKYYMLGADSAVIVAGTRYCVGI